MSDSRKAAIRARMERTRARTLELMGRVSDEDLRNRVHAFYSPVGWHFGHVGRTEESWVCCGGTDDGATDDRLAFLFTDRPDNPKENRVNLPPREEIVAFLRTTRERTFDALDACDLDAPGLTKDGYAWLFADQHECQHQETIAELLHLLAPHDAFWDPAPDLEPTPVARAEMVALPGGRFTMGADRLECYDNEFQPHEVEVAPFRLAAQPVTVGEWREFADAGGYRKTEWWTLEGWAWRENEGAVAPMYDAGAISAFGMGGTRLLRDEEPVQGISAHEADAFARWRELRLPTEIEWEYAASRAGGRFPWGDETPTPDRAVFGLSPGAPQDVASCPAGATPDGIRHLAGNVWEWTSSAFLPYPGFRAFPYDGYSKAHMDGRFRVCRGGSWATSPEILRTTFRNWYVPGYRQGFLGLRLAGDV